MVQIDHLASLPKNARPLDERAEASEEDRKFHWDLARNILTARAHKDLAGIIMTVAGNR